MMVINVLESLVIRVQDKRSSLKLMTLMSQCPYNSMQLVIIATVVAY